MPGGADDGRGRASRPAGALPPKRTKELLFEPHVAGKGSTILYCLHRRQSSSLLLMSSLVVGSYRDRSERLRRRLPMRQKQCHAKYQRRARFTSEAFRVSISLRYNTKDSDKICYHGRDPFVNFLRHRTRSPQTKPSVVRQRGTTTLPLPLPLPPNRCYYDQQPPPPIPRTGDTPPSRHPICSRCLVSTEVKPPTGRLANWVLLSLASVDY